MDQLETTEKKVNKMEEMNTTNAGEDKLDDLTEVITVKSNDSDGSKEVYNRVEEPKEVAEESKVTSGANKVTEKANNVSGKAKEANNVTLEANKVSSEADNVSSEANKMTEADDKLGEEGKEVAEEGKEVIEEKKEDKVETELDKYWKAVNDNPTDFTGWTYLLQYVEQEGNIEWAREAYDAFFKHYPYCYGYWKKYSDLEKQHNNVERAREIYERGVVGIPLSIDLWLHYINFYIMEYGTQPESEDYIRLLYERAVSAAGTEFRSDKLWDSYVTWETSKNKLKNVTRIYDKIFTIPTQLYSHHFDSFKNHIMKHHPKETVELDEFLRLRQEVVRQAKDDHVDDGGGEDVSTTTDAPPGTTIDAPPGVEDTQSSLGDKEEASKIQEKIILLREIIYKENENEVSKRWAFEEAIRRPYFHVKPLERSQLKNWREYLDFEIANGSHERVVVLFERCIIACGLYEDFWIKYTKYLEQHSVMGVRNVYKRVCQIHLPKKPYIHLAWAAFEERQENYAEASEILRNIEKNVNGLVMVALRRISLERRRGNYNDVEELFEEYIRSADSNASRSFFSIKFARYLQKIRGNTPKARTVLKEALAHDEKNEKLFMQLLDVEYQCNPVEIDNVMELFNKAFNGDLPKSTKVKLSQRRMEFLEDFGTCIKKISKAYDEHQKLVKDMTSESKKRSSIGKSESPDEKKVKVDSNGTSDSVSRSHTTQPTIVTNTNSTYDYNWDAYHNSGYPYQYYTPGYGYYQQHYGSSY
ncbi:hypothetical protein LOTGIDRAFT_229414 [Lottia gigantea]|uniref:Pre-mRNA-processing factor 39 n=1 Tax=Lottia gigantea TaxID=225164 RepID=V4B951_LOTGI|nr:hypothetical protein LOTGIDRAFT_229414 [Lottia gigantea]ESO85389.1 hypothetical protein LOTGIDRAFT_229414 [Lottia gigantea]